MIGKEKDIYVLRVSYLRRDGINGAIIEVPGKIESLYSNLGRAVRNANILLERLSESKHNKFFINDQTVRNHFLQKDRFRRSFRRFDGLEIELRIIRTLINRDFKKKEH
jgi:hypothetical protein